MIDDIFGHREEIPKRIGTTPAHTIPPVKKPEALGSKFPPVEGKPQDEKHTQKPHPEQEKEYDGFALSEKMPAKTATILLGHELMSDNHIKKMKEENPKLIKLKEALITIAKGGQLSIENKTILSIANDIITPPLKQGSTPLIDRYKAYDATAQSFVGLATQQGATVPRGIIRG